MKVKINGREIELAAEGKKAYGEDRVLLASDDDLTQHTSWSKEGFSVQPFLSKVSFDTFLSGIHTFYRKQVEDATGQPHPELKLADYHKVINNDQELHLAVIKKTTQLSYDHFPIDVREVTDRISEILKISLTIRNPYNQYERFHLRTVRPASQDFNPLHRDAWLDRLKNGINLYVPVAGSTELSSLCLIPGSHRWEESKTERTLEGAVVNNIRYNVPALTAAGPDYQIIRPNPGYNEVLVFSPYIIHGGAANFNQDQTRISLEMRLWRK